MDACSLRQDQQRGRARWWRSRLRSETGRSEQGRYILRHSAVGGLTGARSVWRKISRQVRSYDMRRIAPSRPVGSIFASAGSPERGAIVKNRGVTPDRWVAINLDDHETRVQEREAGLDPDGRIERLGTFKLTN